MPLTRETYPSLVERLKSGEFDDRPEVKVALVNQAKAFKDQTRLQDYGSLIDLKPSGVPASRRPAGRGTREAIERNKDNPLEETKLLDQAIASGVDIDTGLRAGIRMRASFAPKDAASKYNMIDHHVRADLADAGIEIPEGVPVVYNDTNTGRLTYMRATEDGRLKPTLVDEAGATFRDIADVSSDVVRAAPEVVGSMAGLLGGTTPAAVALGSAGAAAGAAAGARLTQEIAFRLAKEAGIPEEKAREITDENELKSALIAGGTELAVAPIMTAFRMFKNRGRPLDSADLSAVRAEVEKQSKVLRDFEDATGLEIDVDVATMTGDPDLIVARNNVRRRTQGKESDILAATDIRNEQTMAEALLNVQTQAAPGVPLRPYADETGQETAEFLQSRLRTTERGAQHSQRNLDQNLDELEVLHREADVTDVMQSVEKNLESANEKSRQAWDLYREAIEYSPEGKRSNIHILNPSDSPIRAALKDLSQESQAALSKSLGDAQKALVKDVTTKRGGLVSPTLDPNSVHVLTSHLKHQRRQMENGVTNLGWRRADLDKIITALDTQAGATPGGAPQFVRLSDEEFLVPVGAARANEIKHALQTANAATRNEAVVFKRKGIRDLMDTVDDGKGNVTFRHTPGSARGAMLKKNDARVLSDVMDATGNSPAVKEAIGRDLQTLYNQTVRTTNGFSKLGHDKFLAEYADHLSMVFGQNAPDFLRNTADMAALVERNKARTLNVKGALEKAFGKKLGTGEQYSDNVIKTIMGDKLSTEQVHRLRIRLSRGAPDLWADIRRHGTEWMQANLSDKKGLLNVTNLNKLITDHGGRLTGIFGSEYVANLKAVERAMRLVERQSITQAGKQQTQPPLLQLTRSLMGPLSKKQRFITSALRIKRNESNRRLRSILADPGKVDLLVKVSKLNPNAVAWGQVAASLGVNADELTDAPFVANSAAPGGNIEALRRLRSF